MVDVRYPFNTSQSHAIQVHFDAQLLDIIRVLPGAVKLKKLATAMLALIALSAFTLPVLNCLIGVAIGTFHLSILAKLSLPFPQRRNLRDEPVEVETW
jgi:hypothetical protein